MLIASKDTTKNERMRTPRIQLHPFIKGIAVVGLAVTVCSCSSIPTPKLPKVSMPKMENLPLIGKKKNKQEPQANGGGSEEEVVAKASLRKGGAVEFRGFSPSALQDFRVIPEKGGEMFAPQNQAYQGVDGFWWKQQRGLWFKIPNHCSVVVKAAANPVTPSAFTTTVERGKVGASFQKLRGKPDEARFYPDAGATAHLTDYPFDQKKDQATSGSIEDEVTSFLAP